MSSTDDAAAAAAAAAADDDDDDDGVLCNVLCRVISRAPGLKLVVQTLLSSLRPIGNIVLIC